MADFHSAGGTSHNMDIRGDDSETDAPLPHQRPLPEREIDYGYKLPLAVRIQALTLMHSGVPHAEIERKLGVKRRTLSNIKRRAFERGYRPNEDFRILPSYVEDSKRSGRPKEIKDKIEQKPLTNVPEDRAGKEKSNEV